MPKTKQGPSPDDEAKARVTEEEPAVEPRRVQLFRVIKTTRDAARCLEASLQDKLAGRITTKEYNRMIREIDKMMNRGRRPGR